MSKSAPDPPDYGSAAEAQAQSSREVTEQQTWANRPTINTPFGQQTWDVTPQWDPSTGQYLNTWTQNTNLTPESQAALDSQMRIQQGRSGLAESMLGRAQGEYGQEMDWDKFTQLADPITGEQLQRSVGDTPDYYKNAEDAIYNQWSSRQEPRMEQAAEAKRTQLYNAGLKEGDEAYDREMQRLSQDQADARQQAQYQATIGAGQEASRMQGMDVTSGGFANQAAQQALNQQQAVANFQNTTRQQQISEEMQRRGFSLNEINAILTGQQVGMPSMPGFQNAGRSEAVQYNQAAQNQYQGQLDQFNAQQQGTQGTMQGLMGTAMMFSDRRLKKDIELAWEPNVAGVKWYKFRYIWEGPEVERHIGVMADEVLHTGAVLNTPSGFFVVDYRILDDYLAPPMTGYERLPVGIKGQEEQPWTT